MSKKKGYRADVVMVDEAIPTDVKEEVLEVVTEVNEEPAAEVQVEPKKPIYTVLCAGKVIPWILNVREKPSTDARILVAIGRNTELEILDESTAKDWLPVLLADGTKGYCMSKFIKEIK